MATYRCITNNPLLEQKGIRNIEYHYDMDVLDILRYTADEVARGCSLMSHPLTGSIRPDITPYKSIIVTLESAKHDPVSQIIMERAVVYAEDLYSMREVPLCKTCSEEAKQDFQLIDYTIISRALDIEQLQ